jgi:translation initiation factor SUI1
MQQFLVNKFSIGCWCGMIIWLDPFAEANAEDSGAGTKEYVHVRVQQRNGRKSLTTVQGLKKEFSYSKILKDLKKEFCCNGTVVEDPELGQVCLLFFIFKINVLCNH